MLWARTNPLDSVWSLEREIIGDHDYEFHKVSLVRCVIYVRGSCVINIHIVVMDGVGEPLTKKSDGWGAGPVSL